ncbi:MAG: retron system putative HNH endonuclease [Oligosphaeraceae bacterium]
MHKFARGDAPIDFEKAKRKYHNQWNQKFANSLEHQAISAHLYELQSHCCAYCDRLLASQRDGFIEHLARRHEHPECTFDWDNLFLSCRHAESCGIYKDASHVDFTPHEIVDPSKEDPTDYFVYGEDGHIFAKDEGHRQKAEKTILLLNLNQACLTGIRAKIAMNVSYFLQLDPTEQDITDFLNALGDCDCKSVYFSLLKRTLPSG